MSSFDPEAALARLEAAAERANRRPSVPEVKLKDERATVALAPGRTMADLVGQLAQLGIKADDYDIEHIKYRQAGGTDQLTVDLKPKAWSLRPARVPGPRPEPAVVERVPSSPHLMVVCGDQQAPYMDYGLHEAFLRFLSEVKPSKVVNAGDLPNLTSVGTKHRWNPMRTPNPLQDTQRGVDESHRWWSEVGQASMLGGGEDELIWIPGNHEQHLVNAMVEAEEGRLFDIRRAGDPDGPGVMTLRHLCRLDELGVTWVSDPLGDWPRAKYRMGEYVYARHGSIVRPGAGQSVWSALQNVEYTLFVGHVHRAGVVARTIWDRNGGHRTIYGVEIAGMHDLNQQGYEDEPDQQQGFATIWVYPDGTYTPPMLASWIDGALRWGTMTISRTARGLKVAA